MPHHRNINNFEFYRGDHAIRRRILSPEESREVLQRENEYNDMIAVTLSAIFCIIIIVLCVLGLVYVNEYTEQYRTPTYKQISANEA